MLSIPLGTVIGRALRFAPFLLLALPPSATAAPKYLGPNKCISCHDHDKQKAWSEKDKHAKALQQLEDKNAAKYAAAIGLADPYSLKGSCVACHATVFNGDANAGVSCEICHGAGSDYNEPHQQKGSYQKSVALGMIDTRGNYPIWAKLCVDCHIVTDKKLVAAGHKSGAEFETGKESQKIVHWAPAYDFAALATAGKSATARRGGAGGGAPPAKAAPPAKEEAKPTPSAARPSPSPRATAVPPPATVPATVAPARVATPLPTSAPAKKETRAEATPLPTRILTGIPTSAPTAAPILPTAPRTTAVPRGASPTIVIEIVSTPIPKASPLISPPAEVPTSPAEAVPGSAPPRPTAKRPPAKPRPRAKPKPKTTPATPPTPAPTRTPTKLPAPMEPPRRPPH